MRNEAPETGPQVTLKTAPSRFYWKLWGGVGLVILAIVFSFGLMEWRYHRLIQQLRSHGIDARPTFRKYFETLDNLNVWLDKQTGFSLPVPPRYGLFMFHSGTFTEERFISLSGLPGLTEVALEQADISVETLRKFIRKTPNLRALSFVDCQYITHAVTDQLAIDYPSLFITNMGAISLGVVSWTESNSGKCQIGEFTKPSSLEDAGMKTGDIIIECDGIDFSGISSGMDYILKLFDHLSRKQPGDQVVMTVQRGDETLQFTCTLQPYQPFRPAITP